MEFTIAFICLFMNILQQTVSAPAYHHRSLLHRDEQDHKRSLHHGHLENVQSKDHHATAASKKHVVKQLAKHHHKQSTPENNEDKTASKRGPEMMQFPGELPHQPYHVAQIGTQPNIFDFMKNRNINNEGALRALCNGQGNALGMKKDTLGCGSDQPGVFGGGITAEKIKQISNELASQLPMASDERHGQLDEGPPAPVAQASFINNNGEGPGTDLGPPDANNGPNIAMQHYGEDDPQGNPSGIMEGAMQSIMHKEKGITQELDEEMEAARDKGIAAVKYEPNDENDQSLVSNHEEDKAVDDNGGPPPERESDYN